MDPPVKPSFARNLLVRVLLLGVFVLVVRFVYVVAVHGGSCGSAGDFCLLSSPASAASTASFARVAATPALWTSREWRKAVKYYSAVFQDLISEGFLSSASKSLCVDTLADHEVLALREIGVAKKKSHPLVIGAGDLLRLPLPSGFDFVFVGRSLDRSKRPADLASEISRILKPEGFLVLHTASTGDAYSLHSLRSLLPTLMPEKIEITTKKVLTFCGYFTEKLRAVLRKSSNKTSYPPILSSPGNPRYCYRLACFEGDVSRVIGIRRPRWSLLGKESLSY